MYDAFATKPTLRSASRLPALSRDATITLPEVALLLACGAFAALAIGLLQLQIRVPGHAILRAVLPMAFGLAMVPRQSSGILMSIGAGLTATAMSAGNVGRFPPAAMLGVLALGPVLDLALVGNPKGSWLYARFAAAGAVANLLAFAVRFATAQLGWEFRSSRQFTDFWTTALPSFVVCGALAGLISAAVWFRGRAREGNP